MTRNCQSYGPNLGIPGPQAGLISPAPHCSSEESKMPMVDVFDRILSKRKTLERQRGVQGGDGWDLGALRSIVALI